MLDIIRTARGVALAAALMTVAACEDDPVEPATSIDVAIDFAAAVDEAVLSCGNSYANVGTAPRSISRRTAPGSARMWRCSTSRTARAPA